MAFLTLAVGVEPGKRFRLDGERAVIGRSSDCDVPLDVAAVSRRHAAVLLDAGQFFVEDLGSRNGTILNGHVIAGRTPVRDGDRIGVCDQEFTFHMDRPQGLTSSDTAGRLRESTLAQLVDDDEDDSDLPGSVMATIDLGNLDAALLTSANPEVKLKALIEISKSLAKAVSVDEILPTLLESLFKVFTQADRGFVVMQAKPDAPLAVVEQKARRKGQEEGMRISRTIVKHSIENKRAVLSADAASDERFGMAESIAEFQIRSMMCVPMIDSDGSALGVVQIDTINQMSRFTDDDLEVLVAVANQAAAAIDNARLHEQAVAQRALARDLALASRMQRALLPKQSPEAPGYTFFDYYESARQVGGDYYDYISLPDARFAVVLGDVAGKGVAAALIMAKLSSDVRFALATESDATRAMMRINRSFAEQGLDDKFVTMVIAIVDRKTSEVTLVNAGHMAPLLRNAAGEVSEVAEEISGLPLGVY
ncbi:MAG: SpoIIE family protein phosphatase, partial [Planctomycetota bacterium]